MIMVEKGGYYRNLFRCRIKKVLIESVVNDFNQLKQTEFKKAY